jgi:autotransporter-associated beta strand protein
VVNLIISNSSSHVSSVVLANGGALNTLAVQKLGAGTQTLTGTSTYTGGTTIYNGTLTLGAANILADAGAITVAGGTLNLGAFNEIAGAITISAGTITNGTLTASSYSAQSGTISANLAGAEATFAKTGAGTVTLTGSGANTYSGVTTVEGGTLELAKAANTAAIAGPLTVATNAVLLLSVSGQIADGSVTTLSGGTIRRASGVGEVFGSLNVTAASALDFGSGGSGFLQFGTYARDTESALLTVQNFFQGNSLVFSQNLVSAGYLDASSSGSYNNGYFAFADGFTTSWNGTDTFTITAIPEPSTIIAALGLLAFSLWRSAPRAQANPNTSRAECSLAPATNLNAGCLHAPPDPRACRRIFEKLLAIRTNAFRL